MDIQQTAEQLQKFADANGLQMDCSAAINEMDSGDFIELNQAMDNSDNRSILQILQKYKARVSENYAVFAGSKLCESYDMQLLNRLAFNELESLYKKLNPSAFQNNEHLTIAEMKTLTYDAMNEDITSQMNANVIANANNKQNQQQINPQTQMKMKQSELQRNANNKAMKVTVPGNQQGTNQVAPVVGVDVGPTPQQTLVVTKDPQQQNQLQVYGLNDVDPINQNGQLNMSEEYDPAHQNNELMAPAPTPMDSGGPSVLTHTEPGMGEIIHAISDIESDNNVHGDESPLGNSSMDAENDIITQIITNCERIRGR